MENRNRLIIIGASGHGRVVADVAGLCGYQEIVFLDDDPDVRECGRYRVAGRTPAADGLEGDLFVAVGNAAVRRRIMEQFAGRNFPILVHPGAVVAADTKILCGTVVMAGAVINPGARIGRGCIVNTSSSIDHDCEVEDFVHVSVGAHLCGTVRVGRETWIGAGAVVSNNRNICSGCMIGAGAVVVRDIVQPGVYIGVPARRAERNG